MDGFMQEESEEGNIPSDRGQEKPLKDQSLSEDKVESKQVAVPKRRLIKKIKVASSPSSSAPEVTPLSEKPSFDPAFPLGLNEISEEEISVFSNQLKNLTSDITFIRSKKL